MEPDIRLTYLHRLLSDELMLVETIKFCTRFRHVVTAGLSAALKAHGWNCFGFRCGVSVWNGAVLLVTWSYIESEVSHEILNKTNFIVSVKSKGNKSEMKFRIRDFKLKLFVTHFPCEIPPSATVTSGPPCQLVCLRETEQIINHSPLRLTSLGGAGSCIYMSRVSRREPDPWRTRHTATMPTSASTRTLK